MGHTPPAPIGRARAAFMAPRAARRYSLVLALHAARAAQAQADVCHKHRCGSAQRRAAADYPPPVPSAACLTAGTGFSWHRAPPGPHLAHALYRRGLLRRIWVGEAAHPGPRGKRSHPVGPPITRCHSAYGGFVEAKKGHREPYAVGGAHKGGQCRAIVPGVVTPSAAIRPATPEGSTPHMRDTATGRCAERVPYCAAAAWAEGPAAWQALHLDRRYVRTWC